MLFPQLQEEDSHLVYHVTRTFFNHLHQLDRLLFLILNKVRRARLFANIVNALSERADSVLASRVTFWCTRNAKLFCRLTSLNRLRQAFSKSNDRLRPLKEKWLIRQQLKLNRKDSCIAVPNRKKALSLKILKFLAKAVPVCKLKLKTTKTLQ